MIIKCLLKRKRRTPKPPKLGGNTVHFLDAQGIHINVWQPPEETEDLASENVPIKSLFKKLTSLLLPKSAISTFLG